jgi:hypothetical protein
VRCVHTANLARHLLTLTGKTLDNLFTGTKYSLTRSEPLTRQLFTQDLCLLFLGSHPSAQHAVSQEHRPYH